MNMNDGLYSYGDNLLVLPLHKVQDFSEQSEGNKLMLGIVSHTNLDPKHLQNAPEFTGIGCDTLILYFSGRYTSILKGANINCPFDVEMVTPFELLAHLDEDAIICGKRACEYIPDSYYPVEEDLTLYHETDPED